MAETATKRRGDEFLARPATTIRSDEISGKERKSLLRGRGRIHHRNVIIVRLHFGQN